MDIDKLKLAAECAAERAQPKLSNYYVGAAILTDDDRIFCGCNIEFDNYSNTIHAEECAISNMVISDGGYPIAIATFGPGDEPVYPCGMCRQSLYELNPDMIVIAACTKKYEETTIAELLPNAFTL